MDVEGLIREFWQHQYAALELPGLDSSAIAALFGEQVRPSEAGEGVVEVGIAFLHRNPKSLAEELGEWLARRGCKLIPVDPDSLAAETETLLRLREQPGGSSWAVAYFHIEEK